MHWLQENWAAALGAVLGGLGLVVSVLALQQSRAAIRQARAAHVQAQRPWLTAEVRAPGGKVLEVRRLPTRLEVRANVRLRNTGHSVAKAVSFPEVFRAEPGPGVTVDPPPVVQLPPTIDLPPGGVINQVAEFSVEHPDLDRLEREALEGRSWFELGLLWNYGSDLDGSRYRTRLRVRLSAQEGVVLGQDHEIVAASPPD